MPLLISTLDVTFADGELIFGGVEIEWTNFIRGEFFTEFHFLGKADLRNLNLVLGA